MNTKGYIERMNASACLRINTPVSFLIDDKLFIYVLIILTEI